MNLVKISLEAEGYYSEATYKEDIMITKESYEIIKEDVDNLDLYIYELDGKHSETEGDISIDEFTEEELLKEHFPNDNDGDTLYDHLDDIFEKYNLKLDDELDMINKYVSKLDTMIIMEISVKKSQKEKVLEFINKL